MNPADQDVAGAYDRGEITLSRFRDACRACAHARPSGDSFLCTLMEMRVFADTTCKAFDAAAGAPDTVPLELRLALYRANLITEPGAAEHANVSARIAALNGGR